MLIVDKTRDIKNILQKISPDLVSSFKSLYKDKPRFGDIF